MSNNTIQAPHQYMHELHTWERALDFYKQENVFLKTHLSGIIDTAQDKDLLESAELFNNKFVFIDELIMALQQDIRLQSQMLKEHISGGDSSQVTVMNKLQLRLRHGMEKFDKEMTALKKKFNQKIAGIIKIN